LGAAEDGGADGPFVEELLDLTVGAVVAHHEAGADSHALAPGRSRNLPGLGGGHGDGLLDEDVLARPDRRKCLLCMHIGRRRDIDGIHVVPRQQRLDLGIGRAAELRGDLRRHLTIHIHHRGEPGAPSGDDAFGNCPAAGDAAGADHAPADGHGETLLTREPGWMEGWMGG